MKKKDCNKYEKEVRKASFGEANFYLFIPHYNYVYQHNKI